MTPPRYLEHAGTIRIAWQSVPASFATKAIQMLENPEVEHVDFFCIGAEAAQQALKVLTLFRGFYEKNTLHNPDGQQTLAFLPFHVHTMAPPLKGDTTGPKTLMLHGTVFRTIILSAEQTKQFRLQTEETETTEPKKLKNEQTRKIHQRNPSGT